MQKARELETIRGQLAQLRAELDKMRAALGEARAELETVIDEDRAVVLTGLVAARSNRCAQLEKQIAATEVDLQAAERAAARERAAERERQIAEALPALGAAWWELHALLTQLAQLDIDRDAALRVSQGASTGMARSRYSAEVADVEHALTRHGFARLSAGPKTGRLFERVK